MAATGVKMLVGDTKTNATVLTLVGTETITGTVDASNIAIIVDTTTTELNTNMIDATIDSLRDLLKELNKAS